VKKITQRIRQGKGYPEDKVQKIYRLQNQLDNVLAYNGASLTYQVASAGRTVFYAHRGMRRRDDDE
jgi:hypothetical protein